MRKLLFLSAATLLVMSAVSCKNNNKKQGSVPAYTVVEAPQVNLDEFPVDEDGYVVLFDGTSTKGWRGYGKAELPARWTIEDGALKFSGTGSGEGQTGEGGDIIFAHQFKNFTLEMEWKISKGGNSGIFYLAKEVTTKDENQRMSSALPTMRGSPNTG